MSVRTPQQPPFINRYRHRTAAQESRNNCALILLIFILNAEFCPWIGV